MGHEFQHAKEMLRMWDLEREWLWKFLDYCRSTKTPPTTTAWNKTEQATYIHGEVAKHMNWVIETHGANSLHHKSLLRIANDIKKLEMKELIDPSTALVGPAIEQHVHRHGFNKPVVRFCAPDAQPTWGVIPMDTRE